MAAVGQVVLSVTSDITPRSPSSHRHRETFPVHWLVWHDRHEELRRLLQSGRGEVNLEGTDPRGRTPLMLAVTLGHVQSARVLLEHGANATVKNSEQWTVVQEAISAGDPELVSLCLQHRDHQLYMKYAGGVNISLLLQLLNQAPDFYVEMKWYFASWVPFVCRMCPSDTYKIWKSGASVRVDTTLVSYNNMSCRRGKRSYIYRDVDDIFSMLELNHDDRTAHTIAMRHPTQSRPPGLENFIPTASDVAEELRSSITTVNVEAMDKIVFEQTGGGWKKNRTEVLSGYTCRVYQSSDVLVSTKTRSEHMVDREKQSRGRQRSTTRRTSPNSAAEVDAAAVEGVEVKPNIPRNPDALTPDEYFDTDVDLRGRDAGRTKRQSSETHKLKARLWLSDDFPLSLKDQVTPLVELLASTNDHCHRLSTFLSQQLPPGFPVQCEIPVLYVLNARVTFGNVSALERAEEGVSACVTPDGKAACCVDKSVFATPPGYHVV